MSDNPPSGLEDVRRIREILFGEQAKQIVDRIDILEQQIASLRRENSMLRQLLDEEVSAREQSQQQTTTQLNQQMTSTRRELFTNLQDMHAELSQTLDGKDRARQSEILNLQTALLSESETRHREDVQLSERLVNIDTSIHNHFNARVDDEIANRQNALANLHASLLKEHEHRAGVLQALQSALTGYSQSMASSNLAVSPAPANVNEPADSDSQE
ncbi:MAG TPA: hypothetical protein PK299_14090 [Anaerolineales bacterium]|nr:hypothetical protein [Anaerolineales bacterium]